MVSKKYFSHSETSSSNKFQLEKYFSEWDSRKYLYVENYIFFLGHNAGMGFSGDEVGEVVILEKWFNLFEQQAKERLALYCGDFKIKPLLVKEIFGTINLRLYISCSNEINFDSFDFEDILTEKGSFEKLMEVFQNKDDIDFFHGFTKLIENKFEQHNYLFHQHLYQVGRLDSIDIKEASASNKPEVAWSSYSFSKNHINIDDISFWIDFDTYILRIKTLYEVFSLNIISILHFLRNKNEVLDLKGSRKLLTHFRFFIAYADYRSNHFTVRSGRAFRSIAQKHLLDLSKEKYLKIENNLDSELKNFEFLEEDSQSKKIQYLLMIITILSTISILSDGVTLLTTFSDSNVSNATNEIAIINDIFSNYPIPWISSLFIVFFFVITLIVFYYRKLLKLYKNLINFFKKLLTKLES